MSLNYPKSGPNDLAAFSMPGIPWVTGSTIPAATIFKHSFPCATTGLVVRNTVASTTLAVGFSSNGLNSVFRKYFTLTGAQELRLNVRVKEIFLSASQGAPVAEVVAELSTCGYSDFPILTGSVSGAANPWFNGIG